MYLRRLIAILVAVAFPVTMQSVCLASPAKVIEGCDAKVLDVVTSGVSGGGNSSAGDVYVGPVDQLQLTGESTFMVFRPDEVNVRPVRHYPLLLYVGRLKVIDIQDEVAVCRTVELASSEEYPRVRNATVMIGDCVKLEEPKAPPQQPLTVAPEEQPAEMLDVDSLKFSGTGSPEPSRIIPTKILFQFDSSVIEDKWAPELAELAQYIKEDKPDKIVIEGHACSIGTDEYNLKLSERRARAVVDYLVEGYGINRSLFEIKAYGESRPEESNATEAGRIKNRRAVTALFYKVTPTIRPSAALSAGQLAVKPEDLTPENAGIPVLPVSSPDINEPLEQL